jgi:hypothetical protein
VTTIETLTALLSVSTGQTNITAGLNPAVMLYLGLTQLVGCAFGRVVRSFPMVCGFSARSAEKPHTDGRYVPYCRRQTAWCCDAEERNCVSPSIIAQFGGM